MLYVFGLVNTLSKKNFPCYARSMGDFFDDMAKTARDLLKPSDKGGLGARTGAIKYVRLTPATPSSNPLDPPKPPTSTELNVRAQAFGVSSQIVGTMIDNATILATDLYVICERIPGGYIPGDVILIDAKPVTILGVRDIPGAGIRSAVKFFVRK